MHIRDCDFRRIADGKDHHEILVGANRCGRPPPHAAGARVRWSWFGKGKLVRDIAPRLVRKMCASKDVRNEAKLPAR